jgi:hypothetical protein
MANEHGQQATTGNSTAGKKTRHRSPSTDKIVRCKLLPEEYAVLEKLAREEDREIPQQATRYLRMQLKSLATN